MLSAYLILIAIIISNFFVAIIVLIERKTKIFNMFFVNFLQTQIIGEKKLDRVSSTTDFKKTEENTPQNAQQFRFDDE
eukprot:TRINITY_DN5500_c0_g1_i1.p2 TRINITY_DN5500_c0_g1~~TRINITY_DN5500_c0_g1_i1.p2  ORF type:complete len:78 (+),score=12.84 TRINITY_DN5500_c0_g1_i1:102-335(+)